MKTQIHAMEKDQLAHLLKEKNSLQKVQEDRIRNLTEMLVTSASFSSKQNAKVSTDFLDLSLILKYLSKINTNAQNYSENEKSFSLAVLNLCF